MSISFMYSIHFGGQGYTPNLRLSNLIIYKDWYSHIVGQGSFIADSQWEANQSA